MIIDLIISKFVNNLYHCYLRRLRHDMLKRRLLKKNNNVKINIKSYHMSVLNKITKRKRSIYIKKKHLYENKCLYQVTLNSIE